MTAWYVAPLTARISPGGIEGLGFSVVESLKGHKSPVVGWLAWDEAKMEGTLQSVPSREEIPENVEMQLIVELFSR